jgi:hypothetical protein
MFSAGHRGGRTLKRALSLGERVSGDGAFSSRHRTGEGLVPSPARIVRLEIRIIYFLLLPTNPVSALVRQIDSSPARGVVSEMCVDGSRLVFLLVLDIALILCCL